MPTVTATFESRRDAELAVEHLMQENGVERDAIVIGVEDEENTAGTQLNGSDVDSDLDDGAADGAALNGSIAVAVTIEDDEELAEAMQELLEEAGGSDVAVAD